MSSIQTLLNQFRALSTQDQQTFLSEASKPAQQQAHTEAPSNVRVGASSVTGSKPSSHVAQTPGGTQSLHLFGGDSGPTAQSDAKAAYYAAGNKQSQSSIFDTASDGNKSSTRVAQNPGGTSSISFGGDSKDAPSSGGASVPASEFHRALKQAIAEKNPSFQAFFKTASGGGRSVTAAQLSAGFLTLLGKDAHTKLQVSEENIKPLFNGKPEIGQSEFTKLFAQ